MIVSNHYILAKDYNDLSEIIFILRMIAVSASATKKREMIKASLSKRLTDDDMNFSEFSVPLEQFHEYLTIT